MIKVPFMKMPESCDKCDFGRCRYSNPSVGNGETSGKHGWNCQIEYYEKGRYETVREAPYDEHIVPVQCPLIDEDEDICEKCLYAEETDGSHCYECVKGENKFKAESEEQTKERV